MRHMDASDRTPETADITGARRQESVVGADAGVSRRKLLLSGTALAAAAGVALPFAAAEAQNAPTPASPAAPGAKPNIVVIMGDDVGWFSIGAYHRGMMSGKTPNLDKLA